MLLLLAFAFDLGRRLSLDIFGHNAPKQLTCVCLLLSNKSASVFLEFVELGKA